MIKPMQPGFAENCRWFDWKIVWDRLAFAIGRWFLTLSLDIAALLATHKPSSTKSLSSFFFAIFPFSSLGKDVQVSLLVPTAEQVRASVYRTWLGETHKLLEQLRSCFYHFVSNVDWNGENKNVKLAQPPPCMSFVWLWWLSQGCCKFIFIRSRVCKQELLDVNRKRMLPVQVSFPVSNKAPMISKHWLRREACKVALERETDQLIFEARNQHWWKKPCVSWVSRGTVDSDVGKGTVCDKTWSKVLASGELT